MALHSQRQRLQTSQDEKTVERARDRADRVLQKPHSIAEVLVIANNGNASDHVGVTVQIFGCGMNNNVETEFDRSLDPRRGKGVVGNRKNSLFPRNLRDRFQVNDLEKG